jgi:AFG3 family protein
LLLVSAGVEPRPKYYFLIGSVDSFERKLDDAQKELGLDSTAHVPVKYSREVRVMLFVSACGPGVSVFLMLHRTDFGKHQRPIA